MFTEEILQEGRQFYRAFQLLCLLFLWRTETMEIILSSLGQISLQNKAAVPDVMFRDERSCYWMLLELVLWSTFSHNFFLGCFFNGSSRASNDRANFYFVCTHCCHDLLCFNRPFLIIKRDNFSGCCAAFLCIFYSAYCSLLSGVRKETYWIYSSGITHFLWLTYLLI